MTCFAVITEVPTDMCGNLATGDILVYPDADRYHVGSNLIVDPVCTIDGYDTMFAEAMLAKSATLKGKPHIDLTKRQIVFCNVPVFKLGEILIMDHEYGRTIPDGRKPSKWDVQYECFDNIDDAITKAKEVVK